MIENQIDLKPSDYAAIYARKSIKTENNSINTQISSAKEILYKNKLVLYNTYYDEESATKFHYSKRKGFNKLLKDAIEGKFKTVIVYRRDRLARKYEDFFEIKNIFKKHNIKILYTHDIDVSTSDKFLSDFIENIVVGIAEFEPQLVSERTSIGKQKKRERGEYVPGKNLPFAFKKDENSDTAKYVLEEDKVEVVKTIFEKYSLINESYTKKDLLNDVNSIVPPNMKKLELYKLDNIIKNPVYANLQFIDPKYSVLDLFDESNDTILSNNSLDLLHPCTNVTPVIDETLWISDLIKWKSTYKPKQTIRKNYLFKDLLYCKTCSAKITLCNDRYRCKTKKCTSIKETYLIDILLTQIIEDILTTDVACSYIKSQINDLKEKCSALKQNLKRANEKLRQSLLNYVSDSNKVNLKTVILELLESKEKLQEKIWEYEDEIYILNNSIKNIDIVKSMGTKDKIIKHIKNNIDYSQELLSQIIKKVVLHGKDDAYTISEINY